MIPIGGKIDWSGVLSSIQIATLHYHLWLFDCWVDNLMMVFPCCLLAMFIEYSLHITITTSKSKEKIKSATSDTTYPSWYFAAWARILISKTET